MNLKKFDSVNTVATGRGKMTISFNHSGVIAISGKACEAMGVESTVCLYKDEDSERDWYVMPDGPDGFHLRKNTTKGSGSAFNSTPLARQVLLDLDWNEKKAAICRIVPNPVEVKGVGRLYPILISSARKPEL
ncbi:hypothetical protein [Chitinophaga varians]|uniref:hypothetical protein n=1 Tax=Chitinophaga varians TaxID=2202339 RepID=UPI00165F5A4C|nr:hypothetical protein [Chitinophaga varians]MBC9913513.1 hypothetical protein [Chitinophaga varians]